MSEWGGGRGATHQAKLSTFSLGFYLVIYLFIELFHWYHEQGE